MRLAARFVIPFLLVFSFVIPAFAQMPVSRSLPSTRTALANTRQERQQTAQSNNFGLTEAPQQSSQAFTQRQLLFQQRLQTDRLSFKASLAKIKDTRKQQLVTNINDRIASISAEKTQVMYNALTKMMDILNTIASEGQTLKSQGVDTTALEGAITTARQAIATAQASVTMQAGKVYTPVIMSDTTLRQTVGETVSAFRTDLASVFQDVVTAKQAVMQAAMQLAKLKSQTPVSSTSGTMTP